MLPQDLHIHTVFSTGDSSVVPQQTLGLIAAVAHARIIGISDHIEYIPDSLFPDYAAAVTGRGFHLGVEIVNVEDVERALELPVEYRVFHCYDNAECYRAAGRMADSGRPLIIAHPMALGTDLGRIPPECYVEINNRYVWRGDWKSYYTPWRERFEFVYSSDAHQPNWLNQNVARYAGEQLGIRETLLFGESAKKSVA
jgi:histidinol phosphatase-like PHP family hydrolase